MKAIDYVDAGERALVIFTRGELLVIEANGDGQTGDWNVSRNPRIDSLILCHRTTHGNEIFKGSFAGVVGEPEKGRRVVAFTGLRKVGETDLTWPKFADCGSHPIRYISRA